MSLSVRLIAWIGTPTFLNSFHVITIFKFNKNHLFYSQKLIIDLDTTWSWRCSLMQKSSMIRWIASIMEQDSLFGLLVKLPYRITFWNLCSRTWTTSISKGVTPHRLVGDDDMGGAESCLICTTPCYQAISTLPQKGSVPLFLVLRSLSEVHAAVVIHFMQRPLCWLSVHGHNLNSQLKLLINRTLGRPGEFTNFDMLAKTFQVPTKY